jgi:uncharacterized OB-fold protein
MCKNQGHKNFTPFKICPKYKKKKECWKEYSKIREKYINSYEEDKL